MLSTPKSQARKIPASELPFSDEPPTTVLSPGALLCAEIDGRFHYGRYICAQEGIGLDYLLVQTYLPTDCQRIVGVRVGRYRRGFQEDMEVGPTCWRWVKQHGRTWLKT